MKKFKRRLLKRLSLAASEAGAQGRQPCGRRPQPSAYQLGGRDCQGD